MNDAFAVAECQHSGAHLHQFLGTKYRHVTATTQSAGFAPQLLLL